VSRSNRRLTNSDVFAGLGVKNRLDEDGDPLDEARLMPISQVQPNPNQPRKKNNPDKDRELKADIEVHGVLQPIIVRAMPGGPEGQYQIIAGERRWRAAREAGLENVPVIIKEYTDQLAEVVSLVENLQRLDLDPRDEAEFFYKLSVERNISNRDIARMINRSHGYVDTRLKKLGVKDIFAQGDITKQKANSGAGEQVRERAANSAKSWRYRPQPFQNLREYLNDTFENWESISDEPGREALLHDIADLKAELTRLEKKLHVKTFDQK
jgi:ParB/RepB/Spo0J family partition protein